MSGGRLFDLTIPQDELYANGQSSQDRSGTETMTLSDTDVALASIDSEMRKLQERRARVLAHRKALLPADDDARRAPGAWPEEEIEPPIEPRRAPSIRDDGAPLPTADLNRWGADFPWSKQVDNLKKEYFNVDKFRPLQREVINATLSGCDCFVIMPTGGGKSLLYQLPGLIDKGITVVISPLISLMHDQVAALRQFNVPAVMITGETPKAEQKSIEDELATKSSGHSFRFLYVTPEKVAKAKRFVSKLEKLYHNGGLARVVIDECHCCSSWGHDFRPDYLKLGVLRALFPNTPMLACTATATNRVQKDVRDILQLKRMQLFKSSFNRHNLMFEVRPKTGTVVQDIADFINSQYPKMSGIVYCLSKKDSEKVAEGLQKTGIDAGAYHADMSVAERERQHKRWGANKTQIAFGMGINKPDVRFVLHHTLSKSFDAYYQESGRAGRDGDFAHCVLYYKAADFSKQSAMAMGSGEAASLLLRRLNYSVCRRKLMAEHFGEPYNAGMCDGCCDNCANANTSNKATPKDVTEDAEAVLKLLDGHKGRRATLKQLAADYHGSLTKDQVERLIVQLVLDNILVESFSQNAYSTVCYLKRGEARIRKVLLELPPATQKNARRRSLNTAAAQANTELRDVITKLRDDLATADNVPAWTIFEDRILGRIATEQPTGIKQLESMMGVVKANKFGSRIIAAVTKWLAEDEAEAPAPVEPKAKKAKSKDDKTKDKDGERAVKSPREKKDSNVDKDKSSAAKSPKEALTKSAEKKGSGILAFLQPTGDAKEDDFDTQPRKHRPSLSFTLAAVSSATSTPPVSLTTSAPATAATPSKITEVIISDDDEPPAPAPPPSVSPAPPAAAAVKRRRIIEDDEEDIVSPRKAEKALRAATIDELALLDTQLPFVPPSPPSVSSHSNGAKLRKEADNVLVHTDGEHDSASSALGD